MVLGWRAAARPVVAAGLQSAGRSAFVRYAAGMQGSWQLAASMYMHDACTSTGSCMAALCLAGAGRSHMQAGRVLELGYWYSQPCC